jgi:hypothetical protein
MGKTRTLFHVGGKKITSHHCVQVLTTVLSQAHLVAALHDIGSVSDIMLSVYVVLFVMFCFSASILCGFYGAVVPQDGAIRRNQEELNRAIIVVTGLRKSHDPRRNSGFS